MVNNSLKPYLACFSAGLFSFYNLFQLSLFNVIAKDLLITFNLTSTQLGFFSSIYLLANTLWLIPAGILLDKYSCRKISLSFFLIDIIAGFVFAKSSLLLLSILMRFLQGLASAMSLLVSTRLAIRWFPKNLGTAVGLIITFALFGGFCANHFLAIAVVRWGWRNAMLLNVIMGLIFFLITFSFLCESPENQQREKLLSPKNFKVSLKNVSNVVYGLCVGLMNLPVFVLGTLWGVLFLTQAHKILMANASTICSFLFLGFMFGSPLMGFVSDKINNRNLVMLWGVILSMLCIFPLMINTNLNQYHYSILFFLLGLFSSAQIVGFACVAEVNKLTVLSTATSIVSLIANLIGTISQPLFGWLLSWNMRLDFTSNDYIRALSILPIAFIFVWLMILFINWRQRMQIAEKVK